MGSPRPVPTDEKLHAISCHVVYEMKMFSVTAGALMDGSIPTQSWRYNAMLESWVQHLRNLLEFFYGRGGDQEIVRVADFFGRRPVPEVEPEVLRGLYDRANVEISHLSYGRNISRDWDVHGVSAAIDTNIRLFVETVPERHMCPGFRSEIEEAQGHMPHGPAITVHTTAASTTSGTAFNSGPPGDVR